MDEQALRELIGEVRRGRLSRRQFVQAMIGLGLSAPIAGHLLAGAGRAQTRPAPKELPRSGATRSRIRPDGHQSAHSSFQKVRPD